MRLFAGKIPVIAKEIASTLVRDGDIEVADKATQEELELDLQAVLKEYLRVEKELVDQAKDYLQEHGLPYSDFGKAMKVVAEGREFGRGEDAIGYITAQAIGCFMCSAHVEEIYADDATLNRKMRAVLRKHMSEGQDVEREVRARMRNIEEGSREWDVEFQRLRDEIQRKKGLE
ncbi:MAG: DUF507 family protein [Myxococcales bacterium]|nr:DUF507 family protein [Myxococcales bacterium]